MVLRLVGLWSILLLLLLLLVLRPDPAVGDDFPSLLSTNASMGKLNIPPLLSIILDREYLGADYERTLDETKNIVEKLIREHLKNGGLIVKYYSWTSINLKRGECVKLWCRFRSDSEHFGTYSAK
uniref:SEA domain-containing protein n=1 Tax=Anopheles melas TaxID=34690 RepID=A0A182TPQ7_9DIPT